MRREVISLAAMAGRVYANVRGDVLRWARVSAGLDLRAAAEKASVRPEQIEAWEGDDPSARPTIPQLRKLGKAYRRPIAVFYLPSPPRGFQPMHDYRRLPGDEASPRSPELIYEVRRALERREAALELLADQGEEPPAFSLRIALSEEPDRSAARLRSALGIDLGTQIGWQVGSPTFNGWREAVEAAGALVVQMTEVGLVESRGFSIDQDPLPVVAVNWKDTYGGRTFSLLHELTHVALRRGGLCDYDDHTARAPEDLRTEVFCNQVAAAALVPTVAFLAEPAVAATGSKTGWSDEQIEVLARRYGVSREVIVRRLLTLGRTTRGFYETKREQYRREHEERRERDRERSRDKGKHRGPHPATKAVSSAGLAFTRLVLSSYYQDRITASDVSNLLEVRLKHLDRIGRRVFGSGEAA